MTLRASFARLEARRVLEMGKDPRALQEAERAACSETFETLATEWRQLKMLRSAAHRYNYSHAPGETQRFMWIALETPGRRFEKVSGAVLRGMKRRRHYKEQPLPC
jgi:hypothetical protein